MRSANAEQSASLPHRGRQPQSRLCAGQTYLERLGMLYSEEIRLTIVAELSMREMGPQQFYDSIGGRSYHSVRRHFLKLVDYGWLRKVRTVSSGRGRPETLFRATEQAIIDTETWRMLPVSIRDALTVMLLEDMGTRLGEVSEDRHPGEGGLVAFNVIPIDEPLWCKALDAVEGCFQLLQQEQWDAKIRLKESHEQPALLIVNLAAFESLNPQIDGSPLPIAEEASPPPSRNQRIGKVFADRIDYAIVDELNRSTMTAAQLHATLGGSTSQGFLRRCRRLEDLGWAVKVSEQTGGALYGAKVSEFRAAAPNISVQDIVETIPESQRTGQSWKAYEHFFETAIRAVHAGVFNNRGDRHLTSSPILLDAIGRSQVTAALQALEGTLRELKTSTGTRAETFEAGFLVSCFQTPIREK